MPPAELPTPLTRLVDQPGQDLTSVTRIVPVAQAPPVHLRQVLAQRSAAAERYLMGVEIGRGGMGAVLRAFDSDLHREVAVKYLLGGDGRREARFIQEAQITGQLDHPNIVPIHEVALDATSCLFFAMKLVKGRTLGQVLEDLREYPSITEKEYPLSRRLTVLVGVCNALAYAHSRGVIHRDLKPANIMLGDFGEVYVMDWGLAKVLASGGRQSPGGEESEDCRPPLADAVVTSRVLSALETQDGAVLGTAAYMPPEQAAGKLHALDARSDVYALGALLYEMLTLKAPVDLDGGHLAVLARAVEGQILPPEQRTPDRTRAGRIPPELSAVALKALATDPNQRYQSVAEFRRDIELFQDGRAVSAREESTWQTCGRLLRRNRAASLATALTVLVLLVGSVVGYRINSASRAEVEQHYAAYRQEQHDKEERTKKAVPALVSAARLLVERGQHDHALKQVDLALEYDEKDPVARLVRAQLRLVKQDFAGARADLDLYLKSRPRDSEAAQLRELCGRVRPAEVGNLLRMASLFERMAAPMLAAALLHEFGANTLEARQKLLELYRQRLEASWPGLGKALQIDAGGLFRLELVENKEIISLAPLEGVPLSYLHLDRCPALRDLTPLQGLPLATLIINQCPISDVSALRGLPLTALRLASMAVEDLSALEKLPLKYLELTACSHVKDYTFLTGLDTLEDLRLLYSSIKTLAPLRGLTVRKLTLTSSLNVSDLAPLADLPALVELDLTDSQLIRDLTPLRRLSLTRIAVHPGLVEKSIETLRGMSSLQTVIVWGVAKAGAYPTKEFFTRYDAGAFAR